MRSRWLGGWLGLCLLSVPAFPQEAIKLEYDMQAGQVLKYRSWIKMASLNDMPAGSQAVRMQLEASVLYQQTVRDATPQTFTYETEVLSGQTTVRIGDQERQQDVPTSRERSVISRRGEVQEKAELDEQGNPKPEEEEEDEPISDPLVITDRVLEHAVLPDRPVKPGDRWEHTVDIEVAPDVTTPVTLRFQWTRWVQLMSRRCAEIDIRFSFPLSASRTGEETGTMEANGQMNGAFRLYFDPEAGIDVLQQGRVEAGLMNRMSPPEGLSERVGQDLPVLEMKLRRIYHLKASLVEE